MTLRPMARPDAGVMSAMNQIEANRRLRMASQESAEGARIVVVKQAEADAEAKMLLGAGVAAQRTAILVPPPRAPVISRLPWATK
jgi:hypothetical protein